VGIDDILQKLFLEGNQVEGEVESYCVELKNCNCIKEACINIQEKTLNIKYGINGTGKSTISLAIRAKASGDEKQLMMLLPYNADGENVEQCPTVSDLPFQNVKVFDDNYVNQYLFRGDNFFEDSFHVFLQSSECEKLASSISSMLSKLQDGFQKSVELQQVRSLLPQLSDVIKMKDDRITRSGGLGDLLKGNGYGFEKHKELDAYSSFYARDDFEKMSKWATWRRSGIEHMNGESCPFCTKAMDMPRIEKQNEVIKHVFKNSAITTAQKILDFLEKTIDSRCITQPSINVLKEYLGDTNQTAELETYLKQLANETDYLDKKINAILTFKPMNVTREDLEHIETALDEMKIDESLLSRFYCTEFIKKLVYNLNTQVEELKTHTGKLKGLFMQYDAKLNNLIKERKEDINYFLSLAGFPYVFKIDPDGNQKALAYLVPIVAEDKTVSEPEKHLSWGERNSFSLVMFMFESISENADLIVLDDPISAFDDNKKFAIIQRMFDNQKISFRDHTVLLLTHDTQPLIDCIKLESFKRFGLTTNVNASYLRNTEEGMIKEQPITSDDLKNVMIITENIVVNSSAPTVLRIVNLRKLIELSDPRYSDRPIYHVLSNLIHGRSVPKYEDNIRNLEPEIFKCGCHDVKKYINTFDYDNYLEELSNDNLVTLYNGSKEYEKVLVARLLLERKDGALLSLKREQPALYKYVNETNHIENDFIFQLDPEKFYCIPSYFLKKLDEFIYKNYGIN